jgi:DNA-binding NarL/FixJ family response regulator
MLEVANVAGTYSLTSREREVLELLCEGWADKEVAARLGIKDVTVRTYVARLHDKLGTNNRTQLGRAALHLGDRHNSHHVSSGQ